MEVFEERNPAIAECKVAEATLHLKVVTLRARESSRDLIHAVNMVSDEIAVQVKRHREKRRRRREAGRSVRRRSRAIRSRAIWAARRNAFAEARSLTPRWSRVATRAVSKTCPQNLLIPFRLDQGQLTFSHTLDTTGV